MIECQSIGRLRSSTMMVMITTIMQSEKAPTRTVVVLCAAPGAYKTKPISR
jgi:hypothetical protein